MSPTSTSSSKCKINQDGSVSLDAIIASFNSSIREEHAWALCYQCAKYLNETAAAPIYLCTELRHVFLRPDGAVHAKTAAYDAGKRPLRCERELIAGLGMVIYAAMDQGSGGGEERVMRQELEDLIGDMLAAADDDSSSSSANQETDDEGIERDAADARPPLTMDEVVARCERHLVLTRPQTEAHYRAVVRALVAEAIELSTFLEKVAQGALIMPSRPDELLQLDFTDWAKFWVQVMGELRTGVKLKKVNYSKAPIEYELTPYEILMKDIRSCRYNLRKIMVNGEAPCRVTKDAHAIILEFIKSRPPLKKVTERKLQPQALRTLTAREQLLNSIKKGRKLRPTPAPRSIKMCETRTANDECPKPATRRLIKVDFSQFDDFDADDDDDDDDVSIDSPEPGLWSTESPQTAETLEVYDLATSTTAPKAPLRRHMLQPAAAHTGCCSVPQSRPCSRQSAHSSDAESILFEEGEREPFKNVASWQEAFSLDDRLSLTLAEIVHIRAVLTKAELEALPAEGRVRGDAEARKVCFLCLKTRFGLLGPWGHKCAICKRTVCAKCHSKLSIPMEQFAHVPVVLLSPSIMRTPEEEGARESFARNWVNRMVEPGSGGSSPLDMVSSTISDPGGVTTPPPASGLARFRSRVSRSEAAKKRQQMVVCLDCKMMVTQIIESGKVNRSAIRNKTLQGLTLNLSPVF